MPWETPLNSILEWVQGPVAKIISVIIITVTGLTLAFGEIIRLVLINWVDFTNGYRRAARSLVPLPVPLSGRPACSASLSTRS